MRFCLVAVAIVLSSSVVSASSIEDLSTWTIIQDPPHPGMSVEGLISTEAWLRAVGEVPSGTDIGYASVNGTTADQSTLGYYFDSAESFAIAIDYRVRLASETTGVSGIGLGIGADTGGMSSAGVTLVSFDSDPALFSAVGRQSDVDVIPQLFNAIPVTAGSVGRETIGRFFVSYDATTQDVVVGVSSSQGSLIATESKTFPGITAAWGDSPIVVSFFLRSQSVSVFPGLTAGNVSAYFSNFEVLSGTPITIPEPTTGVLAILGALGVLAVKKRTS